jgi:hypothetical protein
MKCLILSAIFFFTSAIAIAQPILTSATNDPVVGDVFTENVCNIEGGISAGPSGPGVTWDLSSLIATTETDHIVSYCDSPDCTDLFFTNVSVTAGLKYFFYYVDTAQWWELGIAYAGLGLAPMNAKWRIILSYPFSYNTHFLVDTAIGDSDWTPGTYFTEIDSVLGDAYGALILPTGTFSNVLRVHAVIHTADSVSGSGITTYKRSESYTWYQPGFHYFLASMNYDTTGGSRHLSSVSYYTQTVKAGINEQAKNSEITISPNPSTGNITIQGAEHTTIQVYNIIGQLIKEEPNTNNISIVEFPSGMYFIKVFGAGQLIKQDKIIKL